MLTLSRSAILIATSLAFLAGGTAWAAGKAKPEWRKGAAGCSPRFAHSITHAPAAGGFLLFAGEHQKDRAFVAGEPLKERTFVFYDDLWLYDVAEKSWTEIAVEGAKPTIRGYHGAAWDEQSKALYIGGGTGVGFQPIDDLWRFDLDARAWSRIEWTGDGPPPRINPQLHLDEKKRRLVLFGGTKGFSPGSVLGDVWFFDLKKSTWTKSKATWSGTWQGVSVLDKKRRRVIRSFKLLW